MNETVVIAGSLAQKPRQAGHTWVFLEYLLGFARLGFEVLFIDRLTPEMVEGPVERSENVAYLAFVMERFGLGDRWCLLHERGSVGLDRSEVLRRVERSLLLLNIMGFVDDEEVLAAAQRRVFLDIDPGYGQMWRELGLADLFHGHDIYVTIAENIGQPDCAIPTCGIEWLTMRQPVVLEEWASGRSTRGDCLTGVGAWRGPYAPIEYGGETYGQRAHEFRRFIELPRLVDTPFEVALDIDPADAKDLALLENNGWRVVDPVAIAHTPDAYRDYIHRSCAEFMVARGMYVKSRCGWFSERSMCYLASGRPVLAQDTGIRDLYPTGEGLLVFSTLEEAVAGVEEITGNYVHHSRAARRIAEEFFDSDKVLTELLEKLGVS